MLYHDIIPPLAKVLKETLAQAKSDKTLEQYE